MKVRGNAQTIADKYLQLGRDAQSSGDTVITPSNNRLSWFSQRNMRRACRQVPSKMMNTGMRACCLAVCATNRLPSASPAAKRSRASGSMIVSASTETTNGCRAAFIAALYSFGT